MYAIVDVKSESDLTSTIASKTNVYSEEKWKNETSRYSHDTKSSVSKRSKKRTRTPIGGQV